MNSRVLLSFTLLAVVWFGALVQIAHGQTGGPTGLSGESGQADLSALMQKALSGDAKAEYLLGQAYMTGNHVSQDYQEAARWYQQAAAQGSADAEFGLGFLYEHGKGVGQDFRQAVTLLYRRRQPGPRHGGKQSRVPV